jgi:hypothetical protein
VGGVWAPASDTIRIAGEATSPNTAAYPKRARALRRQTRFDSERSPISSSCLLPSCTSPKFQRAAIDLNQPGRRQQIHRARMSRREECPCSAARTDPSPMPSRPGRQACRSGPISPCSKSDRKLPSTRRVSSRARFALRIDSGSLRRSSPSLTDVEGVELDLMIVLPTVQPVEIRSAIDAEQHSFAIDHKRAAPVAERGSRTRWLGLYGFALQ